MSRVPPLQFRREDIPDLSTGASTDKLLRGLNGFGAEATSLLNGGLTFAANLKAFAKDVTFTTEDEWTAITPTAPWTAGSPAPMVRKRGARVELRGILTVNGASSGSAAFTLAADHAASQAGAFALAANNAFGAHLNQSGAAGTVWYYTGVTGVSLDGVAWDATDATGGTNGVFPLSIRNEIAGTPVPSHVWVTSAADITNGRAEPVAVGGVSWSVSKDQIVVRDIGNLLAGRKYRVKILVVAE